MKTVLTFYLFIFVSVVAASESESVFSKKPQSSWVMETENAYVIEDKYPQAPVHLLVVSKAIVRSSNEASQALLGEMMQLAKRAARKYNIDESGFRIVINTNKEGGQSVYHLHIHVLGGRPMKWPPG